MARRRAAHKVSVRLELEPEEHRLLVDLTKIRAAAMGKARGSGNRSATQEGTVAAALVALRHQVETWGVGGSVEEVARLVEEGRLGSGTRERPVELAYR